MTPTSPKVSNQDLFLQTLYLSYATAQPTHPGLGVENHDMTDRMWEIENAFKTGLQNNSCQVRQTLVGFFNPTISDLKQGF